MCLLRGRNWRFRHSLGCSILHLQIPLAEQSAADRLLGLRVRIPSVSWMSLSCSCYALSRRGLCNEPIPRPENFCRLCCVIVRDLDASRMRRPWPATGCCAKKKCMYLVCNSAHCSSDLHVYPIFADALYPMVISGNTFFTFLLIST
jgi:hypothetical protein